MLNVLRGLMIMIIDKKVAMAYYTELAQCTYQCRPTDDNYRTVSVWQSTFTHLPPLPQLDY